MKFDVNRLYNAASADEVIVGSKGFVADNLDELKKKVEAGEDKYSIVEIAYIKAETKTTWFCIENDGLEQYHLFYLVEKPQEKNFRPYKDTNEMLEDFKKRCNSHGGRNRKSNPMYHPPIWIRSKTAKNTYLITRISNDEVTFTCDRSCYSLNLSRLFDEYTYLDGSLCGVKK